MSSILGTWLLQYPDNFHQPPEFPCLKTTVAYIELRMPGSDLEQQAHLLLAQLEQLELPEAESDAPAPEPTGETPLDGEQLQLSCLRQRRSQSRGTCCKYQSGSAACPPLQCRDTHCSRGVCEFTIPDSSQR
nr:ral guanine nucleotide dissociation stimulator-like [Vicugna pacos]